jgi:hypothetical protein
MARGRALLPPAFSTAPYHRGLRRSQPIRPGLAPNESSAVLISGSSSAPSRAIMCRLAYRPRRGSLVRSRPAIAPTSNISRLARRNQASLRPA